MNQQQIAAALIQEISVILSKDPSQISPDKPLGDLGIDSMAFVEILVFIEKTFQLKLIESGLAKEDFQTIHSLSLRIASELKG